MEVMISDGKVVLKSPKAKDFKAAIIKAANSGVSSNEMIGMELLPYCIGEHPWGTSSVSQSIDNLDMTDYKKLLTALGELLNPGDDEKKSETPSE